MVTVEPRAREVAADVPDPELPMLTIGDLGILRSVEQDHRAVVVTITPTYSGCPAINEIRNDIRARLTKAGFDDVVVRTVLDPPWSSDDITAAGRDKLAAAGIAPPQPAPRRNGPVPITLRPDRSISCPNCGSRDTEQQAAFSATACKALYRCRTCAEPFEYVKEI